MLVKRPSSISSSFWTTTTSPCLYRHMSSSIRNTGSVSRPPPLVDTELHLSWGMPTKSALAAAASQQNDSMFLRSLPPRGQAALYMALAMALHFGGYEFARSSTLALFTSAESGFSSPAAFPLAMACVSPLSVLLLMGYGRELEERGPRLALRNTYLFSMFFISGLTVLMSVLEKAQVTIPLGPRRVISLSKLVVGLAFVFQNSYAHLIYTQQWSFLGSIMTPTEGSTWFASIAGLTSVASSICASIVSVLVEKVGLLGLLMANVASLFLSMTCAEKAYATSDQYGFNPADEMKKKKQDKQKQQQQLQESDDENKGQIQKALKLFQRVPTLGALFCEVLSFQSLTTILNVCFVTKLKSTITNDADRAAWTGTFYALVNGISGLFQFLVLPLFLKRMEPKWVWRLMPIVPLTCSILQNLEGSQASLYVLAFSFFAAKTMDYSLRNVVNEMVYQPLDFESRFLGKEVIGVFGNRFGKSGMSLLLSALSYGFGDSFGLVQLSAMSTVASLSWMGCAVWLSRLIPKREQAEQAVNSRRKSTGKKRSGSNATKPKRTDNKSDSKKKK